MNKLSAPINQLVERRLWPLALLLLAALAAVPILLAKSSEPTPVSSAPAATTATTTPAVGEPVVALADASRTDRRRNVLGAAKDPFRPARAPRAKKSGTQGQTTTVAPGTSPSPSTSGGTGTTGGLPTTQPPAPLAPTEPKKTYEMYSLMVRFGPSTVSPLPKGNLKRLTALPSVEDAVVIYLGLMKNRRTAVFLVDAAAVVQGDGVCNPSPSNCQTLHLKKGETAFFDVSDPNGTVTQYQLDVVKVVTRRTTDARAARRSRKAVARGGREALRARVSRVGGHRYDARTGTVSRSSSTD